MTEKTVNVLGKFFDENCRVCPSLLRFNRQSKTDLLTESDNVEVTCTFLNPACKLVKEAEKEKPKNGD